MSLILEALRKSEAERQRGRAPGLFVEQQALQRPERRGPPAWALAVSVLLVVLLLGWGWREWSRDSPGATTTNVAAEAPVAAATDAASSAIGAPPATAPAIIAVDLDPAAAAPRVEAPLPGPPSPAPVDPTAAPLPPPAIDPATLPMLPAAVADPVAEVALATPTAAPPAAAPAATAPSPPTPEEPLPRLADLAASERAALPPLRLSMHVYNEDPARRFVIVDDQRLTEGATPAPGLVIEQIRRDGAVLSFNGRRLLLPRP